MKGKAKCERGDRDASWHFSFLFTTMYVHQHLSCRQLTVWCFLLVKLMRTTALFCLYEV